MTPTVRSICNLRGHGEIHSDMATCDAVEVAENQQALGDVLQEIGGHIDTLTLLRKDIKETEAEVASLVKEAFKYGATGPQLARATGLSRERIYQIRDGRR